jgi:hypothetical protein
MNEATTKKTSPAKRIIKWAAIVFVASCLFPPWQYKDSESPFETSEKHCFDHLI